MVEEFGVRVDKKTKQLIKQIAKEEDRKQKVIVARAISLYHSQIKGSKK